MSCLLATHPGLRYFREFFNPTCNHQLRSRLVSVFGSEHYPIAIMAAVPTTEARPLVHELWPKSGYNITKEVYSCRRLEAYEENFDLFGLYRARRHTFPTTRPQYFDAIYESFLAGQFYNKGLTALQAHVSSRSPADREKRVVAHLVAWYLQLQYAVTRSTHMLAYHRLIALPEHFLRDHLADRLPEGLDSERLAQRIVHTRQPIEWLRARESRYQRLGFAAYAKRAIAVLRSAEGGETVLQTLKELEES